jgi:hypothetical protein
MALAGIALDTYRPRLSFITLDPHLTKLCLLMNWKSPFSWLFFTLIEDFQLKFDMVLSLIVSDQVLVFLGLPDFLLNSRAGRWFVLPATHLECLFLLLGTWSVIPNKFFKSFLALDRYLIEILYMALSWIFADQVWISLNMTYFDWNTVKQENLAQTYFSANAWVKAIWCKLILAHF